MNIRIIGAISAALCSAGLAAQEPKAADKAPPIAAAEKTPAPGLGQALATTGKLNTFMELLKVAGIQDDSLRGNSSVEALGLRGGITILAPNDAAFAAMDKTKLSALMKDRAAARAFVMAHVVDQALKVDDMFHADNPTSEKLFKSAGGDEFKLLCDGRAHVGLHHPRINGKARVADFQDVPFNGGFVQEIDAVLAE